MTGRVYIAPAGSPLPTMGMPGPEWRDVGYAAAAEVTIPTVPDWNSRALAMQEYTAAGFWPAKVTIPVKYVRWSSYGVMLFWFGPSGPRKGPGLTGRRYRQARREWARARRAARRAHR